MAEVAIELRGVDRGAISAMSKLTDEERKLLIQSKQLDVELKRLEGANMRLARSAEDRSRRTKQAVDSETRSQHDLAKAYERQMSIRHGAGAVLTQSARQRMKQLQARGPEAWTQETHAFVAQYDATQEKRAAALDKVRTARMQSKRAQNARLLTGYRDWLNDQWGVHEGPGAMGKVAVDFAGRGGTFDGDDKLMSRARRAVARNIAKVPELAGKVTAEEFDVMANKMRGQMEASISRRKVGLLAGLGIIGGGARLLTAVSRDVWDRSENASGRVAGNASFIRELRQIAPDGMTMGRLRRATDATRVGAGISESDAARTVFQAQSAGFNVAEIPLAAEKLKKIGMPAGVAIEAAQKIRENFGEGAGGLMQIMDKLLIAAGPSPATVGDLAGGVGASAAAFKSIGGNDTELLASLGVLSTRLQNPMAAAEQIKSVSNQLAKKRMRIKWAPGERPLQGVELIASLDRLAKENRLMDEQGQRVDKADFLGEMQATNAADQITGAYGAIRGQARLMNATGANPGAIVGRRGRFMDLKTDSSHLLDQSKERLGKAEETRLAPMYNVAQSIQNRWLSEAIERGEAPGTYGAREKWIEAQRSGWYGGANDESFTRNAVFKGWTNQAETQQYFEAILSRKYANTPAGLIQGELASKSAWRMGSEGAIGTQAGRKAQQAYAGASPYGGNAGTDGESMRAMSASESAAYETALRRILQLRTEQEATAKPNLLTRLAGSISAATPQFVKNGLKPLGNFLEQSRAIGSSYDDQVAGYMAGTGMDSNDYRVQIFKTITDRKRAAAIARFTQAGMTGGDMGAVQKSILGDFQAIPAEQMEAVYKTNRDTIDRELADAKAAVANASNPAAKDYAKARLARVTGLVKEANKGDGRIDALEAQGIRDQITGDANFQANLMGVLKEIAKNTSKPAPPPPVAPAAGPQPLPVAPAGMVNKP